MPAKSRAKWRLLKFITVASSDPKFKFGDRDSYTLLKPWPKKEYENTKKFCFECRVPEDVEDLYVDMKTRKLWRVVKTNIPTADIERFAISEALENGIVIEPYDPALAARMAPLKLLQQTLVEWWCR